MEKEIQLEVVGLIYNQSVVNTFGLVLGELNGKRRFSVMIGELEAQSIALKMNNKTLSRPLTHDLIVIILATLNAKLTKVLINELTNDIFYSELIIENEQGKVYVVDARTSDAIALAVRTESPIYIKSGILDKVGIEIIMEEASQPTKNKKVEDFSDSDWNLLSKTEVEKLLDTAVKEERYELAAKIRDVLKEK